MKLISDKKLQYLIDFCIMRHKELKSGKYIFLTGIFAALLNEKLNRNEIY